jgi:hypothetical protein
MPEVLWNFGFSKKMRSMAPKVPMDSEFDSLTEMEQFVTMKLYAKQLRLLP